MKKITLIFFIFLLIFFTIESAEIHSISACGQLGLDDPSFYCSMTAGKNYTITWGKIGEMANQVKITLYTYPGNDLCCVIANNYPNSGVFNWSVPVHICQGGYKIKVTTIDNQVTGLSKIHSIYNNNNADCKPCPKFFKKVQVPLQNLNVKTDVKVIHPDHYVSFKNGTYTTIQWKINRNKPVELILFRCTSRTRCEKVQKITRVSCTKNRTNSYKWMIPLSLKPDDYRIKIKTTDNSGHGFSSKFKIINNTLKKADSVR